MLPSHLNYSTYNAAAYIAPIIILCSCLVLTVIAAYTLILICWPFKKDIKKLADEEMGPGTLLSGFRERGNPIPCWTCIFGGLKLIYGHQLDECHCKHPQMTNIYTVCGRHVRPWLLVVLFMVVIFVCSCTVVTFWCEFLVDEGDSCDDNRMDCFAMNKVGGGVVQETPLSLENCTEYQNDNYTIHCFRFSLNYASALGAAGGVLVLATVIMNAQAGLWIGASSQVGKRAWCLAVGGVTTLNVVVVAGLVAMPIVVHVVPFFKERVLSTDRNVVQFYTYWATFLSAFVISGPIFIIFSKRLRKEMTMDGIEQYISTNSKKMRMSNSVVANSDSDSDGLDLSDLHQQHKYGAV